jgi:hypothetical protein
MSNLLSHHTMSVSPEDPAFAIDTVTPIPTQWGSVIARALTNIIATDTGVVYVSCVQNFAAVAVTVDIWDQTATDDPTRQEWTALPAQTVDWPTTDLIVSFAVEPDSGQLSLPNLGRYTVDAYHRGREDAARRSHGLSERLLDLSVPEICAAARRFDNVEQYLIRMWPHDPC